MEKIPPKLKNSFFKTRFYSVNVLLDEIFISTRRLFISIWRLYDVVTTSDAYWDVVIQYGLDLIVLEFNHFQQHHLKKNYNVIFHFY